MLKTKLPSKPSALLEVALKDLSLVEKDKRYKVDMYTWHRIDEDDGICEVCLAGAVMAKTVKIDINNHPFGFNTKTDIKLRSLDMVRCGDVWSFLENNKVSDRKKQFIHEEVGVDFMFDKNGDLINYHENRRGFKLQLRRLVRILKKFNV